MRKQAVSGFFTWLAGKLTPASWPVGCHWCVTVSVSIGQVVSVCFTLCWMVGTVFVTWLQLKKTQVWWSTLKLISPIMGAQWESVVSWVYWEHAALTCVRTYDIMLLTLYSCHVCGHLVEMKQSPAAAATHWVLSTGHSQDCSQPHLLGSTVSVICCFFVPLPRLGSTNLNHNNRVWNACWLCITEMTSGREEQRRWVDCSWEKKWGKYCVEMLKVRLLNTLGKCLPVFSSVCW